MIQYLKEKLRKYITLILQLDDTPESIARGVAIGMIVAMTPTVGIQMMIVIFISFFIRLNRIAGCIMVYISNPFTLVPIYWLNYWTGAKLFGYEMISRARFETLFQLESTTFYDQFMEFAHNCLGLGWDTAVPMFLGGLAWGLVLGIPLYPITLRAVNRFREKEREKEKIDEELVKKR